MEEGVQEGGKNNLNANVQVHGTTSETDFTEEEEEYANECLPDVYYMSPASAGNQTACGKKKDSGSGVACRD